MVVISTRHSREFAVLCFGVGICVRVCVLCIRVPVLLASQRCFRSVEDAAEKLGCPRADLRQACNADRAGEGQHTITCKDGSKWIVGEKRKVVKQEAATCASTGERPLYRFAGAVQHSGKLQLPKH